MSKNSIVVVNLTTTKYAPEDGYILELGMCILEDPDGYHGLRFTSSVWDRLRQVHWRQLVEQDDESVIRLGKVATQASQEGNLPRQVEKTAIALLKKNRAETFWLVATDGCRVFRYLEEEMPELAEMVDDVIDLTTLDALCEVYNPHVWENTPSIPFEGDETVSLQKFLQNDLEKFIHLRDNFLFVSPDRDDKEEVDDESHI